MYKINKEKLHIQFLSAINDHTIFLRIKSTVYAI